MMLIVPDTRRMRLLLSFQRLEKEPVLTCKLHSPLAPDTKTLLTCRSQAHYKGIKPITLEGDTYFVCYHIPFLSHIEAHFTFRRPPQQYELESILQDKLHRTQKLPMTCDIYTFLIINLQNSCLATCGNFPL